MGRFRRRRLHVMLYIDNSGIRMRSGIHRRSLQARNSSLDLGYIRVSGFNCPM
jgi:hypothetical protein